MDLIFRYICQGSFGYKRIYNFEKKFKAWKACKRKEIEGKISEAYGGHYK
jgi:hypothetical protein